MKAQRAAAKVLWAAVVIGAAFLLSGCVTGAMIDKVASGDVTDAVIARAAAFNDEALEDLLTAEEFLRAKAARLAKAKCLFPLTAVIRYARESEANRKAVLADCGLNVDPVNATVGVPAS